MAALGTRKKSGLKKSESKKNTAVVTDVSPVRPPAATPEEDSTNDVTVEVPKQAPATVPMASESKAPLTFLMSPFSSLRFPCSATPSRDCSYAKRNADDCRDDDGDENGAGNLKREKRDCDYKADDGDNRGVVFAGKVHKADESSCVMRTDSCVDQSDDCDEKSDSYRNRFF